MGSPINLSKLWVIEYLQDKMWLEVAGEVKEIVRLRYMRILVMNLVRDWVARSLHIWRNLKWFFLV